MLVVISWFILAICTYFLWFNRFNEVFKKSGGVISILEDAMEQLESDYKIRPDNFHQAATKTIVLVFSIFAWPFMLYMVVNSYFHDYNKDFEKYFKR